MNTCFVVEHADDGYRWKLVENDERILAVSTRAYETLEECLATIELVRSCGPARVREGPPIPTPPPLAPRPGGHAGTKGEPLG